MKYLTLLAGVSAAAFGFCAQAQAEDSADLLSVGIGYYDILDDEDAADFRLEYRSGHAYWWKIKPWAGVEVTSDASLWAGGGLLADIDVTDNIFIIPSFGAGYYARGSSDLDLGAAIEFRSQIEAAYQFENNSRVGVSFGHLSNASITDSNPGTEVLNLYYHVPIDQIF